MFQITSKDWLVNQAILPDIDSNEYEAFWDYQRELCIEGCYIDGVFIPPELYWHLNMWKTMVDYTTEIGGKIVVRDELRNPTLRDNEFIIFNAIDRAQKEYKGLAIGGSRRLSKSTAMASYLGYGATLDENSQNVLVGTNSDDMKVMINMLDVGLTNLPSAFTWMRVEDDWKKQVTLGIKEKSGKKTPFSRIILRNVDGGNNEEAIAGTKPRRLVVDEAAKNPWLDAYQAAVPGFTTSTGILACSPIVSFTGGNAEKFLDAKKLMFDVEAFNFLSWPDEDNPKRVHGLFLGNKYRQDGKVESNLGDYVKDKVDFKLHGQYVDLKRDSELFQIPMQVANEEKANKVLEDALEKLRKGNDKKKYLKEKMYFPKKVDDIFLNTNVNMFNVESAKSQQNKIKFDGLKGYPVELYQDSDGSIKTKLSNKEVITEWPLKSQDPDAPIVIYEHPIPNAPKFLYIFGIDPYRFDQANYSDSLGSVYVFKRIHSITGEGFQDMIVASYSARPENKQIWQEQVRLLLKYYNGYALCENDEIGFIEYMKGKNEAEIYLAPQPNFQKSLVNKSTVERGFGVSRSSDKVRNFMHGLLKNYLEEVIDKKVGEDGGTLSETVGVSRIFDYALLEEIIGFSEDANCDRLVAIECALALANELDPMIGKVNSSEQDPRYKSIFSKDKVNSKSLFSPQKSMFGGKRKSMF